MAETRIGLREVRNLAPGEVVWDATVPGFGVRRQKGNAVAYVLKYRTAEGRQRWYTIGRHGAPWTPQTARDEAKRLLGDVAHKADPAADKSATREAASMAELCDMYMADARAGRVLARSSLPKKQSTLAIDRGRVDRHIKPLLGSLTVSAVTRTDIDRFMHDVAQGKTAVRTKTTNRRGLARVSGGKTAAARAVGLLGGIFTYAVRRGMRPDNPVHGIVRFADRKRERRLSDEEYRALGSALEKASQKMPPEALARDVEQAGSKQIWPPAIAIVQFLAVTGWRSGEALGMRWAEIDIVRRTAALGDTKTGRSVRPLSHAACEVLGSLTRRGDDTLVFPATRGDGRMARFRKFWTRIAKLSRLPHDVTPHVLRHSFASLANDLGYSEPTIAALLGHKGQSVTSRYVHSADAVLLAAADAVADRTAELMGQPRVAATIVPLRREGLA